MNLGARLARYTGNTTYSDAAEKTYDWLWSVNYIDHDTYKVYDGGHVEHNCTDINKAQFSYSIAVLTQATAFLWNIVSSLDYLLFMFSFFMFFSITLVQFHQDPSTARCGQAHHSPLHHKVAPAKYFGITWHPPWHYHPTQPSQET